MNDTAKDMTKVTLRDLDDTACSNVVVTRQIRRMIRKFPTMKDMAIDCWVCGGHYIRFEDKGDKFKWYCDKNSQHVKGRESIRSDSDYLTKEELNKLIVSTHRAMCDNKEGVDLIDTPEDLLAYAEQKLQEMLKDSADTATA